MCSRSNCAVCNKDGANTITSTIIVVAIQYNGTIRTRRWRQNFIGDIELPVVIHMIKPLITKNTSTPPESPDPISNVYPKCSSCGSRWNSTTIVAATPRKY